MTRVIPRDRGEWKSFGKELFREFREDDLMTYAGALAFHLLLALFPFLLFLLGIVSFFDTPFLFERVLAWARAVLPPQGVQEIVQVIENFETSNNGELLSVGMIGAIWAASGGVRSAMRALNNTYDIEEERKFWQRYLLSVGFTIAAGALSLFAVAFLLIGSSLGGWLAAQLGLADAFVIVWVWLRYPIAAGLLMILSAIVYSALPNQKGFRLITPGSVVAVFLWIVLSLGFRLYVTHFGRYDALYGSIGAVVVLLLYFWLSSIVLLLGGEINAVLRRRKEERTRQTLAPAPATAHDT